MIGDPLNQTGQHLLGGWFGCPLHGDCCTIGSVAARPPSGLRFSATEARRKDDTRNSANRYTHHSNGINLPLKSQAFSVSSDQPTAPSHVIALARSRAWLGSLGGRGQARADAVRSAMIGIGRLRAPRLMEASPLLPPMSKRSARFRRPAARRRRNTRRRRLR
jgi:hypothetical protein